MLKRIAFMAFLAAAALLLSLMSPAYADIQTSKCWVRNDTGHQAKICLIVNYIPSSHTIALVRTEADGEVDLLFESQIEDCDNLRLWNDNQTVIWRKDDAQCDLTKADPQDTWYPGNTLPQSAHANFGWTFYPKLDGAVDPGYTHISLVITF